MHSLLVRSWMFVAGLMLAFNATAAEKTLVIGGVPVTLQELTGEVEVYFSGMRFNRAQSVWNFEVTVKNAGIRDLNGPFALYVDSFTGTTGALNPDGTDGAKAFYDLALAIGDGLLLPGEGSTPRTLAVGFVANGQPSLQCKVYGHPAVGGFALATTTTLNEIGQPLGGVLVEETGPGGTETKNSESGIGVVTLGQGTGGHLWKFSKPGYLPVWRHQSLASNRVAVLPTPRLTPISTNVVTLTPIAGGKIAASGIEVSFGPGSFDQETLGVVTPLTGQTLPALLPLGWSPVQAFALGLPVTANVAGTVSLAPWSRVLTSESAAFVRWNEANLIWEVLEVSAGATNLNFAIQRAGSYAVVVADSGTLSPAPAVAGQELQGVSAPATTGLTAFGTVTPALSPASTNPDLVTALAEVVFTSPAGALPSGILLRTEVSETYDLVGDVRQVLPKYESFIVGYQRPSDGNASTLVAHFPLRPVLLLGGNELKQANIQVDVLPPADFKGGVFDDAGGQVSAGSVRVVTAANTFTNAYTVSLNLVSPTNFVTLVPSNLVVAGFDLSFPALPAGKRLVAQFTPQQPNSFYVLGRVIGRDGRHGVEPVERFGSDSAGRMTSLEPASGGLPGIVSAGQFVLIKTPTPQGIVSGVARNSANAPAAGLPVWIVNQPWMTFSGAGGAYRLVAAEGTSQIGVSDLATGDRTLSEVTVSNWQTGASKNIAALASGPQVVSVSPASGSTNVALVSGVTVKFSEPLNLGTVVPDGIVLLGRSNQPVVATLGFNLSGDTATVLPAESLLPDTIHTIVLSTNIADRMGLKLIGQNHFAFRTRSDNLERGLGAQIISFEPTNNIVKMRGTQGIADPNKPVILVNETSGNTTTVISKPDGSFEGDLIATADDFLSAVFVNVNGTTNTIPVSRQIFADGRVGLFRGGGTIEAEGENGAIQLIVEPGSVPSKTILSLTSVALTNLPPAVKNTPPAPEENAKVLGGFKVSVSGDLPTQSLDVVFPVKPETLGLPQGVHPTNATYALAIPRQHQDPETGEFVTIYEVVDRMQWEDGKLVTHSPPFFGLLGIFEDILVTPLLMTVGSSMTISGKVLAAETFNTGRPIPGTEKYLPGAFVTVIPPNLSLPGLPGRIRPGAIFATAGGTNGGFAMMVPVDRGGSVTVRAVHPKFPNQDAIAYVPALTMGERFAIGNYFSPVDVVFPLQNWRDDEPPYISLSHSPESPQPTNSAAVRIVTTDNASRPSSTVMIDSARTLVGDTNIINEVSLFITNREDVGAFGRREFALVSSPKPSIVRLKISANDDSGNTRETMYPIVFGAAELVLTNTIPASDTNDVTGPFVISSFPSRGARAFNPGGEPIVLKFGEPIDRSILSNAPTVFAMMPGNLRPVVQLSEDQLELSLYFYDLQPKTTYTLTVNSGLKDISGNGLDQDPTQDGDNAYTLTFTTAELREAALPEMQNGGGAVIRGIYAYALERSGGANGKVNVYDLSIPSAPQKVAQFTTPPFPRDVVLIPQYSFKKSTNEVTHHTKDLLAVVGGALGLGNRPWLRVIDISNPLDPELLVGVSLSGNPEVAVNCVQWSAPTLAYMENGGVSAISIVDLQTLILSEYISLADWPKYPALGLPGDDANDDGDYVDPGDVMPTPARQPLDFSGKVFTYGLGDTDQWIRDFVLADQGSFIGIIAEAGRIRGTNGLPTEEVVPAAYRTLVDGTVLEREPASFVITNGTPRRVSFLPQFPMVINSEITRMDLALVSVRMDNVLASEGLNWLYVINVSDANDPHLITRIPMPATADEGVWSAVLRDDGLIALATDQDILLIDPTKLRLPMEPGSVHAAIVGIIPNAGEGGRSFASNIAGLNAVSSEGRNLFVQTAPSIQIVNFATNAPFNPESLVDTAETNIAEKINHFMLPGAILPARFRGEDGVVNSDLMPPVSEAHYFVLVRAPGSAGETIDLAVESLNWAGQPLKKRGFLFAPVHALSSETLTKLDQVPSDEDAPVRALKAWRLSSNPASEFYNVYLSRAFALTYEEMSRQDLTDLRAEVEREILWGGDFLRVSFDPALRNNEVLKTFVGDVDDQSRLHEPGVELVLPAFRAEFIQGPNPGPVFGGIQVAAAMNAINPHSGEMVMGATDMTLPGRKLPIEFRRTSASQSLFDGPFGRGWDFNFNQRVVELRDFLFPKNQKLPLTIRGTVEAENEYAAAKDILFYTGAGRVVAYKHAGTNAPSEVASDPLVIGLGWTNKIARYYLPPPGLFNLFFKFKDGRYARLEPDGKQYWYNASGQLTKIYDRYEKNSLEMVYNSRGELIRIFDEVRRPLEIGYYRLANDPERRPLVDRTTTRNAIAGKIARLLDYSKRDVLFHYTDDGLLEKREGPLVETAAVNGFTGRQLTTYIYSNSSDPTKSGKALVGVIGGDNNGTPLMNATELGQRGRDTVSKLKLANGDLTVALSHQNSARALGNGNAKTVVTAADGSVTDYRFDTHGRPLELLTTGTGTNATLVLTNKTEYYTNGLVKRIVRPEGNSIEYYYDSTNVNLRSRANLVRIVKRPGPRGGPVLEATSEFDSWYNLPSGLKTDYNGNSATITLTTDHRETERVTKGGKVESYVVNEFGMIESHTAIDGIVHSQTYTPEGFIKTKSVGPLTTTYSYAPNSGVTSDQTVRGLASQVIDPEGIPTDFVHDERNQLVRQSRAGLETSHAYNAQGDEVEKRTTVDTGRVVIEKKDYNQLGFMTSRTIREVETDGQTVDLTTTYIPDALNRVKEMIAPAGDRHVIEYDAQGRQQSYEIVSAYKETYGYDGNGNQTSKTVGGATEHYYFDGYDRMVKVQTPTGAEVRVALDGNDNLTNKVVIDVSGQLLSDSTYFVDEFNRYTRVERRHEDGVSAMQYEYVPEQRKIVMTDALGAVSTVFYDTAGREVRTETPTKTNVKFYDDNNNIIRRESHENGRIYVDRYDYNSLNHLTNVTDNAGFSSSILVGLDGRVKATTDREGHQQTNQYTLLGELSADITANAVATKYGYDTNRHINQIADTANRATKQIFHPAGQLLTTILPHQQQIKYTNFTPLLQPKRIEMPRGITVDLAYDAEGRMTNRVLNGFGPSRTESYSYDGMQRPKLLQDPNSKVEFIYDKFEVTREFKHEYTFLENPPATGNLQFSVKQQADKAGNRNSLTYPAPSITVTNRRDITGRLTALMPNTGEPILNDTEYAGDRMIGTRILGNNRITVENAFDAVKRTTARRYVRTSDNKALVDIRYAYDNSGAQLARQYMHRGGRADFYRYDAGYRLRRADVGVRPALGTADGTRTISGFAIPNGVSGNWSAGLFAREFNFDNADLFTTTVTLNPDGVAVAPMPATYASVDDLLHVGSMDGLSRERDEVGNVTRTLLSARIPGNPTPQLVSATLSYNALGQLALVSRDDGVQIVNEYNVLGVRIRRQVTGPANLCVPSDVAFLYDGGNLIEVRDLNNAAAIVGRYYYSDDGDELLAGDISLNSGALQRHYFLGDTLRSVMAVTDAQGGVIERVNYDAWGQPFFQSADSAAPAVSRVTRDGNSLLVEFTEPVLPVPSATQTTNIVTTLSNPANVITIRAGSQTLSAEVRFEENFAGAPFGSVYRVTPSQALSGTVELTVLAGGLQDEWGNPNSAQTLNLTIGASTTLFTGPARGSTASAQLSRSTIESPFLFHGQVYDYESGLLYCRARFYDPYAGLFLQRDPAGYVDGVNQYAGFANNPVNLRDPSGMSVDELGRELSLIGSQASYKEDGIIGAAVGSVLEGVGAVLQLGTGAAEGMDLLESGKPGTWGLLDAMKGAELVTADLKTAFAAGASLHSPTRSVVGRLEGYVLRRQTRHLNMPLHKRILYGKGWHGVEPDAIVKTMKEMNVTDLSVREFGQKAAGRRIAGDIGMPKKPGFVETKTSGPLSTVTHQHWDVHSANVWEKTYTGDLDIFSMKVNGRRATPAEVNRFITRANINYAKMWRKAGNTGVPNVPFRHGAHFHLADMYGKSSGGKIVDNKLIKKIGHPGDTVSIRIDGFGRVSAFSTPRSQVTAEILESEVILKALQREDYGLRGGFPKNWHTWPD